jgi:hypothetical protein
VWELERIGGRPAVGFVRKKKKGWRSVELMWRNGCWDEGDDELTMALRLLFLPSAVSALLGLFASFVSFSFPSLSFKNFPPLLVFQPSLSFQKLYLSSFPCQKPPPLLQLLRAVFIARGRGSGDVAAHGEQGSGLLVGWAVSAAGKARLSWFLVIQGRGALAACRKGTVSKRHCSIFLFFLFFIFLYIFFCGDPKIGYNNTNLVLFESCDILLVVEDGVVE